MTQINLHALQVRQYELEKKFYTEAYPGRAKYLTGLADKLATQNGKLHKAQLSPVTTAGTQVENIVPILVESFSHLLAMGTELNIDLHRAMSPNSDEPQQPLLQTSVSHVQHMKRALADFAALKEAEPSARNVLQDHVVAMSWHYEHELRGRGVNIETALEDYWSGHYQLQLPARAAMQRRPAFTKPTQP